MSKSRQETVTRIQGELTAALKALAVRHDCRVTKNNCYYDTNEIRFTITIRANVAEPAEAQAFRMLATAYGLEPSDLGRVFKIGREEYRLLGLLPKASKFPFLVERVSDGKKLKYTESLVPLVAIAAGRQPFPTPKLITPEESMGHD